jgi:hypothetical protein
MFGGLAMSFYFIFKGAMTIAMSLGIGGSSFAGPIVFDRRGRLAARVLGRRRFRSPSRILGRADRCTCAGARDYRRA